MVTSISLLPWNVGGTGTLQARGQEYHVLVRFLPWQGVRASVKWEIPDELKLQQADS